MESDLYPGSAGLRQKAIDLGGSIDGPYRVGTTWWATYRHASGQTYIGSVREVNSYLDGIQQGLKSAGSK